jgi:hypothetical protein
MMIKTETFKTLEDLNAFAERNPIRIISLMEVSVTVDTGLPLFSFSGKGTFHRMENHIKIYYEENTLTLNKLT